MTEYTYKNIVSKAQKIKTNVEKEYKIGISPNWSYYICKALQTKKNVPIFNFNNATTTKTDYISQQVYYSSYMDMCKRLINYVENNRKLPAYITVKLQGKNYKMKVADYTYMFSRILVYYNQYKNYPKYANVNSKAFTQPTEYPNKVYELWVKTFGFEPKMIDDVCDYLRDYFTYQFYFDDQKSNSEVIKSKSGNCTDLTQMTVNMAEAMGYEWKAIHVRCNQSGTGHIYPMFRKKSVNGGNWFIRDVACISDESRYCVWCEAGNGGTKLAENPSWFLENKNR